ncbi:transcriptional regulator SUPERMAN-like [Cornus florida]|uniref:transcriptional regulator SUPERMAN-like n=1 Tax=Cornus florida TaxID=4283 RepID=UPI00289CACD7|nr:transcriptional regulator SUPERMAN-like [Cornus florida]
MERVNLSSESNKLKDTWECTNLSLNKDCKSGYPWPQRDYKCSFCNKELKSAQALGGHMNIHRREKAKLRLSPSWLDSPIANSSPNPNLSLSLPPARSFLAPYLICGSSLKKSPSLITNCFSSPSTTSASTKHVEKAVHSVCDALSPPRRDMRKKMNMGAFLGVGSGDNKLKSGFAQQDEFRVLKKRDISSSSTIVQLDLDLNIGLIQDAAKEDLDLELRLGY